MHSDIIEMRDSFAVLEKFQDSIYSHVLERREATQLSLALGQVDVLLRCFLYALCMLTSL